MELPELSESRAWTWNFDLPILGFFREICSFFDVIVTAPDSEP